MNDDLESDNSDDETVSAEYEEFLKRKQKNRRLDFHENRLDEGSRSQKRIRQGQDEKEEEQKPLVQERKEILKSQGVSDTSQLNKERIREAEEAKLMEAMSAFKPLVSASEIAHDVQYDDSMKTSWSVPPHYAKLDPTEIATLRKKHYIEVDSDYPNLDIPPIVSFEEMLLPSCLLRYFKSKRIQVPTPIQKQGLPVVLSGRDMIGIAYTGTGKTLVFILPPLLFCCEWEMKLPLERGEGPWCLIVAPSRELADQIAGVCDEYAKVLADGGFPRIRTQLCIGGLPLGKQISNIERGTHILVATPGRLIDFLSRGHVNLCCCRYFACDEADRLGDEDFEEEIRKIITFFKGQRQTVLFSATMPAKVAEFVKSALFLPICVNVGRAGAANWDIIQEVEFVPKEKRIVCLLNALRKTPPPVLIFAERKSDVEDIAEYLLVKGVSVAAIHGGKSQDERLTNVHRFKNKEKDVLVATDVASKGLDFPGVAHVINFDMPREIEYYIHRIGRTGRSGKTGVASTFVSSIVGGNVSAAEMANMLDLKSILVEAKQKIPDFLSELEMPDSVVSSIGGVLGCGFCGGRGHRIYDCPKLAERAKMVASQAGKSAQDDGF